MNRLCSILLTCVLTVSLAACGADEPVPMQDTGALESHTESSTPPVETSPSETQEPQLPEETTQPQEEVPPLESESDDAPDSAAPNENVPSQEETSQEEEISEMNESKKIRFLLDDGSEIIVALHDNPAADALYDMLPMELTFEDFNGTEKIAYLPEELPADGSLDSCDPDVGSLCYYIPWGNLCFFYRDFRASSSLILLEQVESGAEFLAQLDLASSVTAETANN